MGGQQRIYKQRIASTQTLAKDFRAMEMIAASRIGGARRAATESGPYEKALTEAVAAVALHTDLDHPLTRERHDTDRVAVVVIASDRGMAGAYSATVLRESEKLVARLKEEGKTPVLFTSGRRAAQYFRFRNVPVEKSWVGQSDAPSLELTHDLTAQLLNRFLDKSRVDGISAVYLVYTRFKSMMSQVPAVRQMLPLTVVDAASENKDREDQLVEYSPSDAARGGDTSRAFPLYEFVPSASEVLGQLLPLYIASRVHHVLLESAAAELAARQRAMHTATDNANDLITSYTRLANAARQAEITTEINEIVGGADALNNG